MNANRHFTHFQIAGFTYYDGAEAFEHLKIGSKLNLVKEENNRFDAYAVMILFKDYKLGYIPRSENKEISKLLEMGHNDIFEVRINQIDPHTDPEHQIGVIVKIRKKSI